MEKVKHETVKCRTAIIMTFLCFVFKCKVGWFLKVIYIHTISYNKLLLYFNLSQFNAVWLKSDLSLALVYWYVARVRSEETPLGFTCRWPKVVALADQSNSYFRGYESNKDMQRRISGNGINIHGSFRFRRIYRKSSHKQTRETSVKQLKKCNANFIDHKSEKCRFLNEHRNTGNTVKYM